jgi:MSHA pilin protein MshD
MSGKRPTLQRAESGLTLMELILFIIVVSVGLAGVLAVLNLTATKSSDPFPVKQAMAVAEAVIEEISLKNYAKPAGGFAGPWTQANRQYFDSVDDFATPPFTWPSNGIYTQTGASPLAGLTAYKVNQVTVAATTLNGVAAKLITVQVSDPTGAIYQLSAYRTNY